MRMPKISKLYLKDIFSEKELTELDDTAKKLNMTLQELVTKALESFAKEFGYEVPSNKL